MGLVVEPAPVQVPLALPSSAAVTAQAVTGTSRGNRPRGGGGQMRRLARVRRAARNCDDHAARIDRHDAVNRCALADVVGREVVDEWETGTRHAHPGCRAVHLCDDPADGYRRVQVSQLALLRHRVGLLGAVGGAVPVDLCDHVTHRDRHGGIDHALLRGCPVRTGLVAVAGRVTHQADVHRANAHRRVGIDGAALRRRCGGLAGGQPERGRRLAEEADRVVLGRDGHVDRPDGADWFSPIDARRAGCSRRQAAQWRASRRSPVR